VFVGIKRGKKKTAVEGRLLSESPDTSAAHRPSFPFLLCTIYSAPHKISTIKFRHGRASNFFKTIVVSCDGGWSFCGLPLITKASGTQILRPCPLPAAADCHIPPRGRKRFYP